MNNMDNEGIITDEEIQAYYLRWREDGPWQNIEMHSLAEYVQEHITAQAKAEKYNLGAE